MDRRGADLLRQLRQGGAADPGGRRRVARRGDRPILDARVGEPEVGRTRICERRLDGPLRRGPSRSRVLGGVVPGGLGVREPRANPVVVLLAVLHVGHARRSESLPRGTRLRTGSRRDRSRDAQVVGECDRGERGVRAHGRRRHSVLVLRADSEPERQLRLRAC